MLVLAMMVGLSAQAAPQVELATADDCGIVVAIGKAEAAWGANGPNQPFVSEAPGSEGKVYRQQCDWVSLGVGAPVSPQPGQAGPRFAVEKPVYDKRGRRAEADVNFIAWGGPGTQPFISVKHCKLTKNGAQWTLVGCKQGPIT